jgi:intein-encoded DNA endonuclease-like protein
MYFEENKIIEEYLAGKTAKQIAIELNTYNTSIRRVLLRNKIALRGPSETQKTTKNVFLDLSNQEVQYWLGMLAADGTIGSKENLIALELQKKDLLHVKKYCSFIGQIKYKEIFYPKYNTVGYRASFKNKEVKAYLKSLGITNKKSKTIKINFDFNEHFIRGVFDGDGYVRLHNFKKGAYEIATMSVDFKTQISDFLKNKNIKHTACLRKDNIWLIGIYTQSEVKKFYDMIYKNATVFLERKKTVICPLYEETQSGAKLSNSVN